MFGDEHRLAVESTAVAEGWADAAAFSVGDCRFKIPLLYSSSTLRPQRGEGLADGLTVALGIGVIDAPGLGTTELGAAIGVGEMPGVLFRIGWLVGSGLELGIDGRPGFVIGGTIVVPGFVVAGCELPGLTVVCAERNESAATKAAMMLNNLI